MYQKSGQEQESFTTLGSDLFSNSASQVIESFQLNLEKSRETMQGLSNTENRKLVSMRLVRAFDAAEQIIQGARIARR